MYFYGDAPPAMGGGRGAFLWFEDKSSMLDYVNRLIMFVSPGPVSADWGKVARSVRSIVEAVEASEIPLQTGLIRLNKALKDFSQIEWWGTFEAFCESSDPFPRRVRAEFRSGEEDDEEVDEEDEEAAAPISDDETEEFIGFLREYGL